LHEPFHGVVRDLRRHRGARVRDEVAEEGLVDVAGPTALGVGLASGGEAVRRVCVGRGGRTDGRGRFRGETGVTRGEMIASSRMKVRERGGGVTWEASSWERETKWRAKRRSLSAHGLSRMRKMRSKRESNVGGNLMFSTTLICAL